MFDTAASSDGEPVAVARHTPPAPPPPRPAPRANGRASRWDRDGADTTAIVSSAQQAGVLLLEAHRFDEIDPTRCRELRLYWLDQLALLHGFAGEILRREGRDTERPLIADDDVPETQAEAQRQRKAAQRATARAKAGEYDRTRYAQCVADKKCVNCSAPAADGRVHCVSCHAERARRREDARKQRELGHVEQRHGKREGDER